LISFQSTPLQPFLLSVKVLSDALLDGLIVVVLSVCVVLSQKDYIAVIAGGEEGFIIAISILPDLQFVFQRMLEP
jgi:hypothetical protein